MKSTLALVAGVVFVAGGICAGEFNPAWNRPPVPPVNACITDVCAPRPQPQVCRTETVKVPVPVTEYVEEPYQYKATKMVPFEREVRVPEGRWVTDRRRVPCTRTVWERETYETQEARWERRPETRYRRVNRTVREEVPRVVRETVYDRSCDPVTGRVCVTPREVERTVMEKVKRRVCVEEPYTANVRHRVMVPVTKTRRVPREVPSTREVSERRWVEEMVTKRETVMQPVEEVRTGYRKRPVCVTREVERQVTRCD